MENPLEMNVNIYLFSENCGRFLRYHNDDNVDEHNVPQGGDAIRPNEQFNHIQMSMCWICALRTHFTISN